MWPSAVLLGGFWCMQSATVLLFKYGGTAPGRWLPCFLIGNTVGVTSTLLWMALFRHMHANLAMSLAVGGAFLFGNLALLLVFHTRLTPVQVLGVAAIFSGMLCLSLGARTGAA